MTPLERLRATQRDELELKSDMEQGDFLEQVTPEQLLADLTAHLSTYEAALLRQINRRNTYAA